MYVHTGPLSLPSFTFPFFLILPVRGWEGGVQPPLSYGIIMNRFPECGWSRQSSVLIRVGNLVASDAGGQSDKVGSLHDAPHRPRIRGVKYPLRRAGAGWAESLVADDVGAVFGQERVVAVRKA